MVKAQALWQEVKVIDLIEKMLSGEIGEVKPVPDLSSESGVSYPPIEKLLGMTAEGTVTVLESLAGEGFLLRKLSDRIFLCPYCQSPNLRSGLRCAKCGSGYTAKTRLLEHLACGYVGSENEFFTTGKYVCPRCQRELRFLSSDYQSLGMKYKCGNCSEIFSDPVFKWQCLRCLLLFTESEAKEIVLVTYYFNESRRQWLEFELKPKKKFIALLQSFGYEVVETGHITGKSGAEHTFDILAHRSDGICHHTLAIDVLITELDREVSLEEVFRFDDKAYDAGIHDKVLIVSTGLNPEASRFAGRQKIKVLPIKDLERLPKPVRPFKEISHRPFTFESRTQLVQWLKDWGYNVKEKAKAWGRSGVPYTLDILAEWDDSIVKHTLGVGVLTAPGEVSLEAVALFDAKAYDIGIHAKLLLILPRLSFEAKQFAQKQGIKVFEVNEVAKLA